MCILRSDYMIDAPTQQIKLVEYNTIAAGFGCLSQQVQALQEYIRFKFADQLKFNYLEDIPQE